jgi:hypothetical protein
VTHEEHVRQVVRRLNEAFYEKDPGQYFHSQALQVMRLGDELAAPVSDTPPGAFAAEVLARMPSWESGLEERGEEYRARQWSLLIVEAFMLVHHAGEALLRGFFAHLDASPDGSPWLSMSELQGDKAFKVRLKALVKPADMEQLRNEVRWAFLPELEQDVPAEVVGQRLDFVVTWLRRFAEYHLESVYAYNASKHGLSAIPGQRSLSFHSEPAGATSGVQIMAGDAIESLEFEKVEGGKAWYRATRALDTAGLVSMALVASHLLGELWAVGRARHLGGPVELHFVTSPTSGDVRTAKPDGWNSYRLSIWAVPLPDDAAREVLEQITQITQTEADGEGGPS